MDEASLAGRWAVTAFVDGEQVTAVTAVRPPTLEFTIDGGLFVFTGCNRGRGTYTLNDSQVALGPVALTRMACLGEAGDLEVGVLRVLSPGIPLEVTPTDDDVDADRLRLSAGDDALELQRVLD